MKLSEFLSKPTIINFRKKLNQGFSLIELIIVIAILSVIVASAIPALQTTFDAYFLQRNLNEADWQGHLALERMTRDLRAIPTASSITTATSSALNFTDLSNKSVSYSLNKNNLMRNNNVLATGINSIIFTYYTSIGTIATTGNTIRYIGITLNIMKNNTDLALYTIVNLRNLRP